MSRLRAHLLDVWPRGLSIPTSESTERIATSPEELADRIFNRCRTASLLSGVFAATPDNVLLEACLSEAEFQGELEELGSSDVSCMARSVAEQLGLKI